MRHVVITSSLAPATFTNEGGESLSIAAIKNSGKRTKEISYHTTKAVELRAAIAKRNVAANKEALDAQRAATKGKLYECHERDVVDVHPPKYDRKQATYNNRLREALGYSKDYQQTKLLLGLISYFAPEDERSIDQLYKSYCAHFKDIPLKKERKRATTSLSATYSNGMPRVKNISYRKDKESYVAIVNTPAGKLTKSSKDYNKAIELRDELVRIRDATSY